MNYHTVKTAMRQSDGRVTKYLTLCALILSVHFHPLFRPTTECNATARMLKHGHQFSTERQNELPNETSQ